MQAGDDQRALWRNARSEHRGGEQVGCEKHSVHTPSDRIDLIEQRLAVAGILEPALFARGIEWQAGVESRLQRAEHIRIPGHGHRKPDHRHPFDGHRPRGENIAPGEGIACARGQHLNGVAGCAKVQRVVAAQGLRAADDVRSVPGHDDGQPHGRRQAVTAYQGVVPTGNVLTSCSPADSQSNVVVSRETQR